MKFATPASVPTASVVEFLPGASVDKGLTVVWRGSSVGKAPGITSVLSTRTARPLGLSVDPLTRA